MCDQRKRLYANEDIDNINIILRAPLLKPLKDSSILIPELQLTIETPITYKQTEIQPPFTCIHNKRRQRFQKEIVKHTVINMMERQLLSRNTSKMQIENDRF